MAAELLLDRYEIIETIGRGGSSEIIKAFDRRMERIVAIKSIPANKKTALRALREGRTVALLNHPNIVTVYEFDETDDFYYLIMEYIDGLTLEDFLASGIPIEPEIAIAIAIQVCVALENAHSNDVIHRDIKPANLMLLPDGRVKVMDFGVSKLKGVPVTREGQIAGTFSYMSPEQAKGELVDERSDVWSLGVVLYEMMTGLNPFDAETPAAAVMKIVNSEPETPSGLNSEISSQISKVVMKTLAKYPENRYDLATDLRYKLERYRRSNKSPKTLVKEGIAHLAPAEKIDPNIRPLTFFKTRLTEWIDAYGQVMSRVAIFSGLSLSLIWMIRSQDILPLASASVISLIVFVLGIIFPRAGLLSFSAILITLMASLSIPLSIGSAVVLLIYWYFFSQRYTQIAALPFIAPFLAAIGLPFVYPIGVSLITGTKIAALLAALGYLVILASELIFSVEFKPTFTSESNKLFLQILGPLTIWQLGAWTLSAMTGSLIKRSKPLSSYVALIGSTALLTSSYYVAPEYLGLPKADSVSIMQPMTFSFIIVLFALVLFDHPSDRSRSTTGSRKEKSKNSRKGAK